MSFCAFAQLVTKFIFFSLEIRDKSHVKWDNFQNSTQILTGSRLSACFVMDYVTMIKQFFLLSEF